MAALNTNDYAYVIPPTAQFKDEDGLPYAAGFVEFYTHGTSEKYITYADWAGSFNPFRIPLNSQGRAIAIIPKEVLLDMYVYNHIGNLAYTRLNVGASGSEGGDTLLRFISSDGSINITRDNNTVDFTVNQDEETYGNIVGLTTDNNGAIVFSNVVDGNITLSGGKLVVKKDTVYHITLAMKFSTSNYGTEYYTATVNDSEGGSHEFVIDTSRTENITEVSWDMVPESNLLQLALVIPSYVSLTRAQLYIHDVSALTVDPSGGGMSEVVHDETLTGDGTTESPLGVAESITEEISEKLSSVSVDGTTITGDGTPSNPLVAAAQPQEQADWAQTNTSAVDYIKNKPQNLVQDASYVHTDNNFTNADKTKLDGIESGAEANVQADWNQTNSSADDYIKNKPTISNVPAVTSADDGRILTATYSGGQGSYDWADPQTFSQQQSNWTQTDSSAVDYIKNKPQNLVQDASYVHTDNNFTNADKSKLDGIEAGAEANDVEDVRVNGTSVVSNKIANVTVPTKTSDLTNDSGFITSSEIPAQVQSDWTEADSSDPSYIQNKPNLATVATSGSYNDLSDKPTIPTVPVQDVEVNGTSVVNASGVAEVVVPTKTSDLNNDSGFITASQVPAQEQSDWNQSNSSAVDYIKNKPQNLVQDASYVHTDNNFTTTLKDKLDGIEAGAEVNVQSDWNQSDNTADDYIKNKPQNLVQDASYVHTDNNFTTTLKDKLDGIAAGAEVNVQSDWNQSDSNADDYIKNKPTINNVPAVTSSDDGKVLKASYSGGVGSYEWANESGGTVIDVTVNGSSVVNAQGVAEVVVPAQQQSNWTQSDSTAVDYIKNKPQNLTLQAGANISIVENSGVITISSTGGGVGTVTDVTVDGSSVVNAQGVAVITMPTELVPAVTSSDDGKLLKASYNNNTGTYSWETVTIPAAQVNSDWNASSGVAQILNKPSIPVIGTVTL